MILMTILRMMVRWRKKWRSPLRKIPQILERIWRLNLPNAPKNLEDGVV
jgi:hypothetical protein